MTFTDHSTNDIEDMLRIETEKFGGATVNYSLLPLNLQERLLEDGDVYFLSKKQAKQTEIVFSTFAGACGLFAGLFDFFWVDDYDLSSAHEWGKEKTESFVIAVANNNGYEGDNIKEAIKWLEGRFKFAGDKATNTYGGSLQHHLRDYSHHFSLYGLLSSVFTQFSDGKVIGTNKEGDLLITELDDKELIGSDFPEKVYNGVVVWFFHLVSDMAGSSSSLGEGTGIPGPILSAAKVISSSPFVKSINVKFKGDDVGLSVLVSKLFNGTAFIDETHPRGIRFDLRTELGLGHQLVKKIIPDLVLKVVTVALFKVFVFQQTLAKKNIKDISLEDIEKLIKARTVEGHVLTLDMMLTFSFGAKFAVDTSLLAIKTSKKQSAFGKIAFLVTNLDYYALGTFVICAKRSLEVISQQREEEVFVSVVHNPGIVTSYLSYEQRRILDLLQLSKTRFDIEATSKVQLRNRKKEWYDSLESMLTENDSKEIAYSDDLSIYADLNLEISKSTPLNWLYMMALSLCSFRPYYKLHAHDESAFKLYFEDLSYEREVFCVQQNIINYDLLERLWKEYDDAVYEFSGRKKIQDRWELFDAITTAISRISTQDDGEYDLSGTINSSDDYRFAVDLIFKKTYDNIFEYSSSECAKLYVFAKCILFEKMHDMSELIRLKDRLDADLELLEQAYSNKKQVMMRDDKAKYKKMIRKVRECDEKICELLTNS